MTGHGGTITSQPHSVHLCYFKTNCINAVKSAGLLQFSVLQKDGVGVVTVGLTERGGKMNSEYAFENLTCDSVYCQKQLNICAAVFIGRHEKKQTEDENESATRQIKFIPNGIHVQFLNGFY